MKRLMTSKVSYNSKTMILLFQKTAMNLELPLDDSELVALKHPLWVCGIYMCVCVCVCIVYMYVYVYVYVHVHVYVYFNESPLSLKPYHPEVQRLCL